MRGEPSTRPGTARSYRPRHGPPPWLPVGVGVNTGLAYVGAVGEGPDTELTAMGDTVNTTARLASAAGAGEILVTGTAAGNAGLEGSAVERRTLLA